MITVAVVVSLALISGAFIYVGSVWVVGPLLSISFSFITQLVNSVLAITSGFLGAPIPIWSTIIAAMIAKITTLATSLLAATTLTLAGGWGTILSSVGVGVAFVTNMVAVIAAGVGAVKAFALGFISASITAGSSIAAPLLAAITFKTVALGLAAIIGIPLVIGAIYFGVRGIYNYYNERSVNRRENIAMNQDRELQIRDPEKKNQQINIVPFLSQGNSPLPSAPSPEPEHVDHSDSRDFARSDAKLEVAPSIVPVPPYEVDVSVSMPPPPSYDSKNFVKSSSSSLVEAPPAYVELQSGNDDVGIVNFLANEQRKRTEILESSQEKNELVQAPAIDNKT